MTPIDNVVELFSFITLGIFATIFIVCWLINSRADDNATKDM